MRKLDELKKLGDPVVFRFKEDEMREDWINAVKGTITNYSQAAKVPGDLLLGPVKCCEILGKTLRQLSLRYQKLNCFKKWVQLRFLGTK